jgi:guanylate cyclase
MNTNECLRGFHQTLISYTGTLLQQVETVGQVYMAVSGAPEYTPAHAENVADVALCLLRQVKQLQLPSGIRIQIRIGKFLKAG